MNANFDALETAVDGNASDIAANAADIATNTAGIAANTAALSNPTSVKFLANGQVVGSFLSYGTLLNFEDFEVRFRFLSGQIQPGTNDFLYLQSNCQGQAYGRDIELIGDFLGDGGAVFRSPFSGDPVRLYYWDADSTLIENQTFLSSLSEANGGCSNADNVDVDAYPVYPNDPAITGVSSEFYDLPIRIGHR